ncbi:MAG: hypothetical protein HQL64_16935 [Magnetococcales bacterium]|nr:hypothetical protein [Magnetococcales bacterium]
MSSPIGVSNQVQDIDFIEAYYRQSKHCLEVRKNWILEEMGKNDPTFSLTDMGLETMRGATPNQIRDYFDTLIEELENLVKLALLSSAEGHIRYDFANRINNNDQHPLTKQFSALLVASKFGAGGVKLPRILDAWIKQDPRNTSTINVFGDILELRHWLAHGRWWNLKPGLPPYAVSDIYHIVDGVLRVMGLIKP